MTSYPVTASAGSLRADPAVGWVLPHAWTREGVVTDAAGTGAHVLHLSVALCVLNDTFREGRERGAGPGRPGRRRRRVPRRHVGLDRDHLRGGGPGGRPAEAVERLLAHVEEIAEIPRTVRAGADVRRVAP